MAEGEGQVFFRTGIMYYSWRGRSAQYPRPGQGLNEFRGILERKSGTLAVNGAGIKQLEARKASSVPRSDPLSGIASESMADGSSAKSQAAVNLTCFVFPGMRD